jgi:hypothetical protein
MNTQRLTIVAVIISLLLTVTSHASRSIPDDNLSYPVFIAGDKSSGSGFYLNAEPHVYLITARHVLFDNTTAKYESKTDNIIVPTELKHRLFYDQKNKLLIFDGVMSEQEKDEIIKIDSKNKRYIDAIQIIYKKSQKLNLKNRHAVLLSYSKDGKQNIIHADFIQLNKDGQIKYKHKEDVAAIIVGGLGIAEQDGSSRTVTFSDGIRCKSEKCSLMGLAKASIKKFEDVLISNEIFVFGYPSSLAKYPLLNIETPLLRKGIIAGKNKEKKIIILDCTIYYGDSGGLVIEVEESGIGARRYRGVGIVKSLVPFVKADPENFVNSGYSIAESMDPVLELIEE